jgi:hypothetical protein
MALADDVPDENAIYRQIGRPVVFFQLLENQVFPARNVCSRSQQTGKGKAAFADVWFKRLVS